MASSPGQVRREKLEELFGEVLQTHRMVIRPVSVTCQEFCDKGLSKASFVWQEARKNNIKDLKFQDANGQGFIDSVFSTCMTHYSEEFESLKNIKFKNLLVQPIFRSLRETGTNAETDVVLRLEVQNREEVDFTSRSRSILFSSYATVLSAFQFYINCELAFRKLKLLAKDAKSRNRGDLLSDYLYKISHISEMNSYRE